jgi:putative membrane protein
VSDAGLILSIVVSSIGGAALGFAAGLVPGLHMNNIAALLSAYAGFFTSLFALLHGIGGTGSSGILAACFISSAVIGHLFSESITSTFVGIPSEDTISVLPAHRLAKAGLGTIAVRAASNGSLAGVLIGSLAIVPICMVMGPPIRFYDAIKQLMGAIILFFSAVLLASEGLPSLSSRRGSSVIKILKAVAIFEAAGVLGMLVLRTNFFACSLPDFPWREQAFVPKSALLLPLFAGLFGIPSLLLSLGSRSASSLSSGGVKLQKGWAHPRECVLSLLGGVIVGWMPGMTSGSAATLCSPGAKEITSQDSIGSSVRFIWLYSSISATGAVFSVGALFIISRARSGSMDAVEHFLGEYGSTSASSGVFLIMGYIVLAMMVGAVLSRFAIDMAIPRLGHATRALCSDRAAIASILFVSTLSMILTGTRGALLLATACALGLLPPLIGVRRIQLMGCLLVPIMVLFLTGR